MRCMSGGAWWWRGRVEMRVCVYWAVHLCMLGQSEDCGLGVRRGGEGVRLLWQDC